MKVYLKLNGIKTSKNVSEAKDIMNKSIEDGNIITFDEALNMVGQTFDTETREVYPSKIEKDFYNVIDRIHKAIDRKTNREKIIDTSGNKNISLLVIMMFLVWIGINIKPSMMMEDGLVGIVGVSIWVAIGLIILLFLSTSLLKGVIRDKRNTKTIVKIMNIFNLIWLVGFVFFPVVCVMGPYLLRNPYQLLAYIIGLIIIVILTMFSIYMPKRTEFGNDMLEKSKGFVNFMTTCTKEEIESIMVNNPNYMYDILPYAYSLNIYEDWLHNFRSVNVPELPTWYETDMNYTKDTFATSLTEMLNLYSNIMTTYSQETSY